MLAFWRPRMSVYAALHSRPHGTIVRPGRQRRGLNEDRRSSRRALVMPGQPLKEVSPPRARPARSADGRGALGVAVQDASAVEHVLADGQADAGCLFVAERLDGVEQRSCAWSRCPPASCATTFDEHFREAVAGHRAVRARSVSEVEEEPAVRTGSTGVGIAPSPRAGGARDIFSGRASLVLTSARTRSRGDPAGMTSASSPRKRQR